MHMLKRLICFCVFVALLFAFTPSGLLGETDTAWGKAPSPSRSERPIDRGFNTPGQDTVETPRRGDRRAAVDRRSGAERPDELSNQFGLLSLFMRGGMSRVLFLGIVVLIVAVSFISRMLKKSRVKDWEQSGGRRKDWEL